MARTPAQRGRIGNWLVESRLSRGWETQERARAEIARLGGWKIPQSVYAEWESGRRLPSDANLERLQAFYGTQPGQKGTAAPDDPVAAAIDRQTKAIEGLTRVLEERLEELRGAEEGRADVLQALLLQLVGRVSGNAGAPERQPAETR